MATSFAADRARRSAGAERWLARLLGAEPGVALVAVGGFGRRELLPGSDLDLLLLLHDGIGGITAIADRIWYPVWDSGTRLDHSVRTLAEARKAAAGDLRVALGLIFARHVAGDATLSARLRERTLRDWRAAARIRLAELRDMRAEREQRFGELAFLLEPDLKEARGGLRDVHALQAVAAAWVAPAPGPRVRAAYETILDVRHALHEVTGRGADRLVFQEQDEVAKVAGLLDGDALLGVLAEAGRTVAHATDHAFRQASRLTSRPGRRRPAGRPLADGVVEQDGEVVLARSADPQTDPALVLRAAAAAAQAGLPLAPRTLGRLARCPPLPDEARDALIALLGAGQAAVGVWEALDQEGFVTALLPGWEWVRNRPQRNPLHRHTVDRHLVETAGRAAALACEVARPDLLLLGALLHDVGKGWPGDHSARGELAGEPPPRPQAPRPDQLALAARGEPAALVHGDEVTVAGAARPGLLWQAAGVLASHRLVVRSANVSVHDGTALTVLRVAPEFGEPPDAALLSGDLRRMLDGRLDIAERLRNRSRARPPGVTGLPPPKVTLVDDASSTATVIEIRAHDEPGLLWHIGRALGECGLDVRAARVETLGAEAVDVFYVVDGAGRPVRDLRLRGLIAGRILEALTG